MSLAPDSFTKGRDSVAVGSLHALAPTEDLKKALECPICKDVPLAPIFTCSLSHTTCGKCRNGLSCGICGETMNGQLHRNLTIEAIVASSSFWCKFLSDGCPAIVKGSDYRAHAAQCDFRRVNCYEWENEDCKGALVRYRDYFAHLKNFHEIGGFELNGETITMSEYSNDITTEGPWPVFFFKFDDEIFLRKMFVKNSVTYWHFAMLGSADEAERYKVKIKVFQKNNTKLKCEWTIPVHSIRLHKDEIEESYKAGLPSKHLKSFCAPKKHPAVDEIYQFVFDVSYTFNILY